MAATANPSGPVDDDAFEAMAAVIVEAARQGHDAILLDLHGAMATRSLADAEGELLARVHAAAPGVPLGVALDLHGNVTPRMLAHCDVIVGFKTYPHIDMYETGEHVAGLVERMLRSGLKPKMALAPSAAARPYAEDEHRHPRRDGRSRRFGARGGGS